MTECISCDKAPVCHNQLVLDIAKLRDIKLEIERFNYVDADEKIKRLIANFEARNAEVTGR